jgi:hypothetical protein
MRLGIFLFTLFCIPFLLEAQENSKPWLLNLFVGGASFCDDQEGCFGTSGIAYGGSFGRSINERLGVEGEFAFACTWENLEEQINPITGQLEYSELERERLFTGGSLIVRLTDPQATSHLFASVGVLASRERQKVVPPEGIIAPPDRTSDVQLGLSAGIGYNWFFSDNWGIRPEARFYFIQDDLSALRYTGGLIRRF